MTIRLLAFTAVSLAASLVVSSACVAQQIGGAPVAGQRIEAWIPIEQPTAIQPAGHAHLRSAPGPYGYAGYGYGSAPYGVMPPYVHAGGPPDRGHPGRPLDGGWYGRFGAAHGTPGYPHRHHLHREYVGPQGPPTAQVAYPYYTTRGPRDFLIDNPPTIGR